MRGLRSRVGRRGGVGLHASAASLPSEMEEKERMSLKSTETFCRTPPSLDPPSFTSWLATAGDM